VTTPQLRYDLMADEGLRLKAYKDSVGVWTVGYGHAYVAPGTIWTKASAEIALDSDIQKAAARLDKNLPWWRTLDDARQDVLCNMAFNLGNRLFTFSTFLGLVKAGQYTAAASDMLTTLWAKQVGARAQRLSAQMRTGVSRAQKAPPSPVIKTPAPVIVGGAVVAVGGAVATQVSWTPMLIIGVCAIVLALVAVAIATLAYWRLTKMSAALDRATASVAALETAVSAATAEIASLKAGSDDTALNGLSDRVDAATASLNTASGTTAPVQGQVG
jgi:lysozyme